MRGGELPPPLASSFNPSAGVAGDTNSTSMPSASKNLWSTAANTPASQISGTVSSAILTLSAASLAPAVMKSTANHTAQATVFVHNFSADIL